MANKVFESKRRPGSGVRQTTRSSGSVVPIESDLPAGIAGAMFRVINDEYAGSYNGSGLALSYPEIDYTAKVNLDTLSVIMKNVILLIAKSTKSNLLVNRAKTNTTLSNITVNDVEVTKIADTTSGAFSSLNLLENDTLIINYTVSGQATQLKARIQTIDVSGGLTDQFVVLDKKLPVLTAYTWTYSITRESGVISGSDEMNLNDATSNVFLEVFPNDDITINHPVYGEIKTYIKKVTDLNNVVLGKSIPLSTNVNYSITRKKSNITEIKSGIGNISQTDGNVLDGLGFITDEVHYGDLIRITIGNEIITTKVIKEDDTINGSIVVNNIKIRLEDEFTKGEVVNYYIYRNSIINAPVTLTESTHYTADSDNINILANLQIEGNDILSSDIYTSFDALETAYSNTKIQVNDITEIPLKLGKVSQKNPLALAASLACANTITTVNLFPIEEDSAIGWLNSLEEMEKHKLHDVCLLTQSVAYNSYLITHVDGMNGFLRKGWRQGWVNYEHPYESILVPLTSQAKLTYVNATESLFLYDINADFTNLKTNVSYVTLKENSNTGAQTNKMRSYKVLEKVTANKIRVSAKAYTDNTKGVYTVDEANIATADFTAYGDYLIKQVLTREEQAQALALTAYGISNRKINYITNEECVVTIDNVDVTLPGMYLLPGYCGLASGTYPHQMLTNYPLSGYKAVKKGSDWFSEKQLGYIAAGGGWVCLQDEYGKSPIYAWQQVTTDTSDTKTNEYSYNKNLDEISYSLASQLDSDAGVNARYAPVFSKISKKVSNVLSIKQKITYKSPFRDGDLGPQIETFSFQPFRANPDISDGTIGDVTVTTNNPLNYIDLNIIGS